MNYRHSILIIAIILPFLLISSCRDREEPLTARCSSPEADVALKEAEANLKAAGVPLSFDDPSQVTHPESFLPDPETLKDTEKQRLFEAAIEKFNIALEELDRDFSDDSSCSVSDRALLHLHLGLVYILDAISRFLISDESPQTFVVERDPDLLYRIDVTPDTKVKLDAAKTPEEHLLVFTTSERQGIIDFFDLLDDAVVRPTVPNIQPQSSSVNRPPYSRYAVWHLQKAMVLFSQYDPEIQESIKDFNALVEYMRATIQVKSVSWGFTYTIPPGR